MNAPLYTAEAGFDKAAIMRRAAVLRRAMKVRLVAKGILREGRSALRSEPLRNAWQEAHGVRSDLALVRADAEIAATLAAIPRAVRLDRAAQLERTAYGIDCADRDGSRMAGVAAMQAEARQLRAA